MQARGACRLTAAAPAARGAIPTFSLRPMLTSTRAAIAMLAAVALFSLMDAGLKQLSGHYPPFQVAFLRAAASLPLVLPWALMTAPRGSLRRPRWSLQLLRAVVGMGMMASFIYAVRELPLSTTYAIFFVAPLLIAALSVPLLKERVGPRRWTAIAIGLLGVIVVLRPSGDGLALLPALATLFAAFCYALSAITVRFLARTDNTQSMMLWLLVLMVVGNGLLAFPAWTPLQMGHAWTIAGIGVVGALGQYAITEAFRTGEASALAPLEYTALFWGVLLDLALWGVLPDAITWLGAAIIIASGLYLIRRERALVTPPLDHP